MLRPKLLSGGQEVEYFIPKGKIPRGFTAIEVQDGGKPLVLGLKMQPEEFQSATEKEWSLEIFKDVRLPALVSSIKAAHLTLFCLLGYRYALSAAGHFVGNDVLGKFLLDNAGKGRRELLENARVHFSEFVHMVRPVHGANPQTRGTIRDREIITCWGSSGVPWAMIVFVRTGDLLNAVMIPVFEHENAIAAFTGFLRNDCDSVVGRTTIFDKQEVWKLGKSNRRLHWPKSGLLYP